MKKQKSKINLFRYSGSTLYAKREISFDIKLSSRLILDQLCNRWNKQELEKQINKAIDTGDELTFKSFSKIYKHYI